MEEAGERIDQAAEQTMDKAEKAAEQAGDKLRMPAIGPKTQSTTNYRQPLATHNHPTGGDQS